MSIRMKMSNTYPAVFYESEKNYDIHLYSTENNIKLIYVFNFTLNSIFRPEAFIKKKHAL